jgi:hypothetical protein
MAKKITDDELIMDGYRALYAAATPPADFLTLINECRKYIDYDGKIHYTEEPLTPEECSARGWKKDIGYMDYELEKELYDAIVEGKIKEHKLKGYRAQAFKNTMYLGCGPKFKS